MITFSSRIMPLAIGQKELKNVRRKRNKYHRLACIKSFWYPWYRVNDDVMQYETVNQLKTAINDAYLSIELELLNKLVDYMSNRILEVLKCKGESINY